MAQQKTERAVRARPRSKASGRATVRGEPRTSEDWQRECERLSGELVAAREEIATLRARQQQVLDRIDWVLDSLDSLSQHSRG